MLAIGVLRFVFKFSMITYLPLLLVDEHGLSLTQSGVVVGVSALDRSGGEHPGRPPAADCPAVTGGRRRAGSHR